jgi:hypothetical protein
VIGGGRVVGRRSEMTPDDRTGARRMWAESDRLAFRLASVTDPG